ncbi:hypothetical protein Y710_03950 [Gordonia sp. QH-12]|uniref:hypothetical protein n=1 Tax=Gordonia sp. QH-12 TaxID=1437876 RepID=UPI00079B493F|nr:hypothetical protein [Gordonia sp. QH-12]KXT58238.1 hypothetical protein Y710_03950 [Gordonia sp. QH-12]
MAEMTSFSVPTTPESVVIVGTGGSGKIRAAYENGTRVGDLKTPGGEPIWRLNGVSMSVDGVGVDGVTIDTSTPLETVPAGVVFRASGRVTLTLRADGRPGFGDGGPRGVLIATAFVERLDPVGNVADLLAAAPTANRKAS